MKIFNPFRNQKKAVEFKFDVGDKVTLNEPLLIDNLNWQWVVNENSIGVIVRKYASQDIKKDKVIDCSKYSVKFEFYGNISIIKNYVEEDTLERYK